MSECRTHRSTQHHRIIACAHQDGGWLVAFRIREGPVTLNASNGQKGMQPEMTDDDARAWVQAPRRTMAP